MWLCDMIFKYVTFEFDVHMIFFVRRFLLYFEIEFFKELTGSDIFFCNFGSISSEILSMCPFNNHF